MNLVANIVSLIGCLLMVGVGFIKKKERVLLVQCVQLVFQGSAHLMLGAAGGFACSAVCIARNLAFIKCKPTLSLKVGFILLQVVMTLCLGQFAPIEIIPIAATVVYNWFLDTKNPTVFKIINIVAQSMWVFYDWHFGNFSAVTFGIMAIFSNLVGIWLIRRK